jgi:hypothetical protein
MIDSEVNMSHRIATAPEITIRTAREDDLAAISRVAGRDTNAPPAWPILVAEVGADIRAAISLTDGEVVADPFHRTAEIVEMLRIRARAAGTHRPALRQPSGWRITGLREAAASSSRRTGVV